MNHTLRRHTRGRFEASRAFGKTRRVVWLGLFFFVLCSPVHAQDVSAGTTPAPPDVNNLPADWWSYISSVAPGERAERLERLFDAIRQRSAADPARSKLAADLVSEIGSLTSAYVQLLKTRPSEAPLATSARAQYTFADVLGLHARAAEAALELNLARELVQRGSRNIAHAEKRLSNDKAKYRGVPLDVPARFDAALRIISERLRISIESEQLRIESGQLANREKMLAVTNDELAYAVKELLIDEEGIRKADSKAAASEERAQAARREAIAMRTSEPGTSAGDNTQENALRAAKLIATEALSTEHESVARRYTLQASYLAARFNSADEALSALHDERISAETFASEARAAVQVWRKAAERERSLALQFLSRERDGPTSAFEAIAEQRVVLANDISRVVAQIEAEIARIEFIEQLAAAFLAAKTGRFENYLAHSIDFVQGAWTKTRRWALSSLFEINETPVTLAGLLRVLIILIAAIWVSKALRHGLERLADSNVSMNRSSLYILGRIFHYLVLGTAFLIALSTLGLDFTKLAFIAGAVGVGIGFGLQAIFSNFISGIIVLIERSLKVGDFVELESGVTGEVREINIRSTLITTNDNIDILVPNSEFVNGRVINWTLRDAYRRVRIPFGVAYGTDKELVQKAALEAADEVPFTLKNYPKREPQAWLVEFGDSSLNFELIVWLTTDAVRRPGAVHAAYIWAIETALGKYGIEIPFPQRDLHVRSVFGHKGEDGLERLSGTRRPSE